MPTYKSVKALKVQDVPFSFTEKDTMLYALSVGMGRDPLDPRELRYVFERPGLLTIPSQATVVAQTGLMLRSGLDFTKVLHGEQRVVLHRPLPAAARLLADSRVVEVYDKGEGKGVAVVSETLARDADTGERLFTLSSTTFARGDGGVGGPGGPAPAPHKVPTRSPDIRCTVLTRADQALLYRLNGDLNPLHADPTLAQRAGFKAPILHGLCTYGIACRDVVRNVCDYDGSRIETFDVRFTSPVYPGEEITTDIWVDGDCVSFQCRVEQRDATVLGNGRCTLRPT
ncbi:MaoC family dehydratase [soil metagenome]